MASNHESPFWNQDAIVAGGLAFAGMAVLQSKLLPQISGGKFAGIRDMLDWQVVQWWPVLLIVGGLVLWFVAARGRRARHSEGGEGANRPVPDDRPENVLSMRCPGEETHDNRYQRQA